MAHSSIFLYFLELAALTGLLSYFSSFYLETMAAYCQLFKNSKLPASGLSSWSSSVLFLHYSHLQFTPHFSPAWKHSQYFFKQFDFLQWHPFACCSSSIFGLNASGFLSINVSIALFLSSSQLLRLWHPTQLQPSQF